jgi:hypothetical protein
MQFAAVAMLGLTMGQPLPADYYPMNSRTIKLPIEYKKDRKTIRQVQLFVARNGENTWYNEGFVTPDKDAFVYVAKDDGVYWFKMVIEDLKGNKDPADLTRDPADLKMVIDTVAPQIRVTEAKRTGEEIVIQWMVEDKFPNDAETKVHFRPTANANGLWQEVTLPANSRTGVKFPSGLNEAVTVRITAVDVAGNKTEITRDFPSGNGNVPVPGGGMASTSLSPGNTGVVVPPPSDVNPMLPVGPGPVAPPIGPGPVSPSLPGTGTVQPLPSNPVPPMPNWNMNTVPALPDSPKPLATVDPKAAPAFPAQPTIPASGTNPTVEVSRAQVINFPRFDLGFDLEQRGPSGISRVDVWVTRDEGKSWHKWSQHDGKGGTVRVVLDVRENTQLEGNYGFRLVPVSGAGLSEREPVAGDAPDMRVVLDVTAPQIELFPPTSDTTSPDTLLLQWKATDRNFGDNPITLEWSEAATGPWKPLATNGDEPIVQATAINTPVAKRLPNTGQFAWRVPAGVPARVYLKVSARDAAGNVKEVITREPILVDLTKPRAKINGIVPSVTPRP